MKLKVAACLLLFSACTTAFAAEANDNDSRARTSVSRAIRFLETDMLDWKRGHGCAACHHGPMYLWSMHVARQQGYSIDLSLLDEMKSWLLTDDRARIFPKPSSDDAERPRLSQPILFLTHALRSASMPDAAILAAKARVVDHLAAAQNADGSFTGSSGRPPIFNTPQILTLLAVSALDEDKFTPGSTKLSSLLARSESWLSSQPLDKTHQGSVLRLLWQSRMSQNRSDQDSDAHPSSGDRVVALVDQLLKQQRPDGGWSQSPDRPSDAFATGQTLYALSESKASVSRERISAAIAFLVRTQQADGSWPMTSRPDPQSGRPADFLNPITYAATAWASLGIATHVSATGQQVTATGVRRAVATATRTPQWPECPIGECPSRVLPKNSP